MVIAVLFTLLVINPGIWCGADRRGGSSDGIWRWHLDRPAAAASLAGSRGRRAHGFGGG